MGQNITQKFISIFGSKVVILFLTVITTPIIVRLLDSDGYGDYSFILSAVQVLFILITAGSFNGIRKYIAEDRPIDGWAGSVYRFYTKVIFGITIPTIIIIVGFARSDIIVSVLGKEFSPYFYIIALLLPMRAIFRTSRSALMGLNLEHYSESLKVLDRVIFTIFIVTFFHFGGDVEAILIGRTTAYTIVGLSAFIIFAHYVGFSTIRHIPTSLPKKKLLSYSAYSSILTFLMVSLYNLDIILLRIMVGSTETGYYRAALVVAEFLWFVPLAVQATLVHSTSRLWVEEKFNQLTVIATQVTRYTLLFLVLLVLGVMGLARPLLTTYFGPEFEAATIPLLLLLPGVLGFALIRPILAISQGQENLRVLILSTSAAALLNFVLNISLIPLYGMNGAAIATSISYGSMFFAHVWSARFLGFDPLADIRFERIVLTGLIAGIPIIILPMYINSDILALIIIPVMGFTLYSVLALKFGAIDLSEILHLIRSSPVPMKKLTKLVPEKYGSVFRSLE
ncbi:polysaccharide biosynthesis C-terminal domain-containing protein [Halosolutus halophilus]|uniref:oligosaccharide flippase family protein n=1 Tax=Halosolutus halophilus TaxID=1552990 RepID=UPI0022351C25|nr:polysaccharide biosynthesis C-terminal domain-containing protein [Halosolutus halophilus]